MTRLDMILIERLQNIGIIDKYKYLNGEEILLPDQ